RASLHGRERVRARGPAARGERRARDRAGGLMRDLVVAGGGPVGLATALLAARAGLDVEVREPRRGVIDKACGAALLDTVAAAGIPVVHRAVAAVADRGGHVEVDGTPARHLVAADGLHSTVR